MLRTFVKSNSPSECIIQILYGRVVLGLSQFQVYYRAMACCFMEGSRCQWEFEMIAVFS